MKQIYRVLLLALCIFVSSTMSVSADAANEQEDISMIKERLIAHFLTIDTIDDGAKVEAILVSEAAEHLESMNDDGSWSDVDYAARENAANGRPWSPYLALDRMQAIAIAYRLEGHALYQSPAVIDGLNSALKHWKSVKPSSTNWWENDIGVNLRFSRIGLFLERELDQEAFSVITNSLNKEGVYQGTGQNNLWYDQNAIYRALITNDPVQLKKVLDECLAYVLVLQTDNTTLEALQVDNSLYFHGIQFYSNGYGLSMFRDMSFWLYMLRDTEFMLSEDVVNRMSDYMLDGTKWTIRGDIAELYLGYRPYKYDVNYHNYAAEYIEPLERMMQVDPGRSAEYRSLVDNIKGTRKDNGSIGNNYMWRVGYGSQMNEKYGVNIKMDSKRITGGEWRGSWPKDGDKGNLIYWTSSASSTFIVDGDEYTSVFPTFDWAHSPGVTSPGFIPKNYSNYGRFSNNTDHTIGLSNGDIGSTSYSMDKYDTKANKSYFFFGDEIVALGSGIGSKNENPIHTTINQTKSSDLEVDGQVITSGTQNKKMSVSTMHNNNIGYIFPKKTNLVVNNTTQETMPSLWDDALKQDVPETFSAWIDHGTKPQNESYSYVVVPGLDINEFNTYVGTMPITIIENSNDIHAVRHNDKKVTQVNFFKPGTIEYAEGKTVTVDKAVNLMIDESGTEVKISVAFTDTDYNKSVVVTLNETETTFKAYPAPYTGKTLTLSVGDTNEQAASSSVENREARLAFDENLETYWKSEASETEWITKNLGKSVFVSSLTIDWGDNYAVDYKIQGSVDGHQYFDISDHSGKNGGSETININQLTNYIRVLSSKTNQGLGIEIAEISIDFGENISQHKNVEVSSTSSNDPGNIASNAVDGNASTRWSSKRDSNDEWIMVDLGGNAEISALNLNWEAARSGKYTIEISDDKKQWTVIETVEKSSGLVDSILFDTKLNARFIRVNSSQSVTEKYGISLFEFEVFGTVEPSEFRTNLALNKPSESSSNYTNPKSGFELESKYAFDGSVEKNGDAYQSRWVSKRDSHDEWILVDLEDIYLIDSVVLNWEDSFGKQYKILTSIDNENWEEVYLEENGKKGITEIELVLPVDARYVKMQGIEVATKYGYSIWEFEVYGSLKEPENIALNKQTKSSSDYSDKNTGFKYESKYAVDGLNQGTSTSYQSRWVSERETTNEWIYVNLDGLYSIDQVSLDWEGAHAKDYLIQTSNDALHWEDVVFNENGKAGLIDHVFDTPVKGQYVRVKGITPATKYGFSIWELEVYGTKMADAYIDTSNLLALINQVASESEDLYTLSTYSTFKESLSDAVNTLENAISQDNVNDALTSLTQAYDGLVRRDTNSLDAILAVAKGINETAYTQESYQVLEALITEAEALLSQGANINEEYATLATLIEAAIEALEEVEGVPGLSPQEIADGITSLEIVDKKVVLTQYEGFVITIASSSDETVIDLNGDVFAKDDDTSIELVLRVAALEARSSDAFTEEITVIVLKEAIALNYQGLQEMINLANALKAESYTQSSYDLLTDAVKDANDLILNGAQNQQQILDAIEVIKNAISNLKRLGDKTEITKLIEEALVIDLNDKTEDSIAVLKNAIADALRVRDDLNAEQQVVNEALASLRDAISGLKNTTPVDPIVPQVPVKPEEPKPDNSNNETSRPKPDHELPVTGTANHTFLLGSIFLFAGMVIFGVSHRKREVE